MIILAKWRRNKFRIWCCLVLSPILFMCLLYIYFCFCPFVLYYSFFFSVFFFFKHQMKNSWVSRRFRSRFLRWLFITKRNFVNIFTSSTHHTSHIIYNDYLLRLFFKRNCHNFWCVCVCVWWKPFFKLQLSGAQLNQFDNDHWMCSTKMWPMFNVCCLFVSPWIFATRLHLTE